MSAALINRLEEQARTLVQLTAAHERELATLRGQQSAAAPPHSSLTTSVSSTSNSSPAGFAGPASKYFPGFSAASSSNGGNGGSSTNHNNSNNNNNNSNSNINGPSSFSSAAEEPVPRISLEVAPPLLLPQSAFFANSPSSSPASPERGPNQSPSSSPRNSLSLSPPLRPTSPAAPKPSFGWGKLRAGFKAEQEKEEPRRPSVMSEASQGSFNTFMERGGQGSKSRLGDSLIWGSGSGRVHSSPEIVLPVTGRVSTSSQQQLQDALSDNVSESDPTRSKSSSRASPSSAGDSLWKRVKAMKKQNTTNFSTDLAPVSPSVSSSNMAAPTTSTVVSPKLNKAISLAFRSAALRGKVKKDPGEGNADLSRSVVGTRVVTLRKPELLPFWTTEVPNTSAQPMPEPMQLSLVRRIAPIVRTAEYRTGDSLFGSLFVDSLVTTPTSPHKIIWDILSFLMVLYDIITLPLGVFGYEKLQAAKIADLVACIFWSMDIVFNFFIGFHRADGCIEMRVSQISKRYIRTWFSLDLTIVAADAILLLVDATEAEAVGLVRAGKTLRTVRIARCIRMLRLVRMMKLLQLIEELCDVYFSGPLLAFINIMKLLAGLALVVHFIACCFYAIGYAGKDDPKGSWVAVLDAEDASLAFRYVISYHWTMAQFTPAPCNYHPQNFQERLFAICVLFIGLVLFSSLLGTTTALLNQSRQQAYAKFREADLIRRFLSDNHVSLFVGTKVTHHLKSSRQRATLVCERDVPALKGLPKSVQIELHYEIYSRLLVHHALFFQLDMDHQETLADIAHTAVSESHYTRGDEPFIYRAPGLCMWCVRSGLLEYRKAGAPDPQVVGPQEALSEATLAVSWEHRGVLRATQASVALKVDGEKTRIVATKHASTFSFLKRYAKAIAKAIGDEYALCGEVDDLFQAFTTTYELAKGIEEIDQQDGVCSPPRAVSDADMQMDRGPDTLSTRRVDTNEEPLSPLSIPGRKGPSLFSSTFDDVIPLPNQSPSLP